MSPFLAGVVMGVLISLLWTIPIWIKLDDVVEQLRRKQND